MENSYETEQFFSLLVLLDIILRPGFSSNGYPRNKETPYYLNKRRPSLEFANTKVYS